jgi:hypothetical protein
VTAVARRLIRPHGRLKGWRLKIKNQQSEFINRQSMGWIDEVG